MADPWVHEELASLRLPDKRLDRRLAEVLSLLAARPQASIPAACGGHAEMTAAYRFFDNDRADFDRILAPHVDATRRRVAGQAVVVVVQDTTEIDLTRPASAVAGAGPLDAGSRRGLLLHLAQAFAEDGTPLGALAARTWAREDKARAAGEGGPRARPARPKLAAIPIESKESYRWVETLRALRAEARRLPGTRLIAVADSEADFYEMLAEARAEPGAIGWIVRACQDRATLGEGGAAALRERLGRAPVLYAQSIPVRARTAKLPADDRPRRASRGPRTAEVEVRAARVKLRPPWRPGARPPAIELNAVRIHEPSPPEGEEPLEWILLTDLPIDDPGQVRRVAELYATRWMVEVLFKTLKSGCRVEGRRFEAADRHRRALAVYLIVAWRVLFTCRLARGDPGLSCEVIFDPSEWKAVYRILHRRDPPATPPPLGEMVRLVARLGGYVDRPSSGPPGPCTVWLGLQRAHDFGLAWKAFGPDARGPTDV